MTFKHIKINCPKCGQIEEVESSSVNKNRGN